MAACLLLFASPLAYQAYVDSQNTPLTWNAASTTEADVHRDDSNKRFTQPTAELEEALYRDGYGQEKYTELDELSSALEPASDYDDYVSPLSEPAAKHTRRL